MLHWALMARLAAESCTAATAGNKARLSDLRAQAWGQLGNALRVYGRWGEAKDVILLAERYRASGTGDSELRARLLEQTASLRMAQRDFTMAAEMLDEAVNIHEDLGEASALARSLVLRAAAAHQVGQPDCSIRLLNRAIALLDPLEDSELVLVAQRNQGESYLEVGQPRMTLILQSSARHIQGSASRALRARMDWQEGKLLSELGSFSLAEAVFLRVRQELTEMRLAPDIPYLSVDLAILYRRMGDEPRREQVLLEGKRLALELRAEA
jgi:tetratricopeptide (TPR) repeat protein